MNSQLLLIGVLVSIPGSAALLWPKRVARWKERTDAVGSRRDPSRVEPTRHRVGTTRYVGLLVLLVGLTLVGAGVLV